jgi:hypothetical protein
MVFAHDAASAGQRVPVQVTRGLIITQRPPNPGEGASRGEGVRMILAQDAAPPG